MGYFNLAKSPKFLYKCLADLFETLHCISTEGVEILFTLGDGTMTLEDGNNLYLLYA